MEIERIVDGQKRKFTLTSDEVWQAYFEKEAEFDMYDVIEAVRVMDDEDRLALEHSLDIHTLFIWQIYNTSAFHSTTFLLKYNT